VAEQFDTAKNATPTPGQFDEARREFTAAQARRDPTGMAILTWPTIRGSKCLQAADLRSCFTIE
jgi:hypothetical protein